MPKVPYQPFPTAQPSEQGIPAVHVQTPGAAFGENVGAAIGQLGGRLEHVGDELFQRANALQQLENETLANEADAKYYMAISGLHADFTSKQGLNAGPAALAKYQKDLDAVRVGIRDSLPNDAARKKYDSSSLHNMARTIFNGAGHSGAEMKKAANGASVARNDMFAQDVMNNPKDDINFENKLREGAKELKETQAALQGWTLEQTQDQVLQWQSKLLSHRIVGLSREAPYEAKDMMNANWDRLHWQDKDRVKNTVDTKVNTVGARNIADKVLADLYQPGEKRDRALKDYVEEAKKEAKKLDPNNEQLPDFVEKAIISKWNNFRSGERQFENDNVNTIYGVLDGSKGKIPATIDELLADPKAAAAYDALDQRKKSQIRDAIVTQSQKGMRVDSTTSLQTRQQFEGMATNDHDAFMNADLYSRSLKLNDSDRRALVNLRTKMAAAPEGDPKVANAITQIRAAMGPEMQALNIYRREKGHEEDYDRFTGALQQGLEAWRAENKRAPNNKELIEQIAQPLLRQKEGGWFPKSWFVHPELAERFGSEETQPPLYKVDTSTNEYTAFEGKLKADVAANGGYPPTDEQIRRAYIRTKFIELYSKPKTK